MATVLDIGKFMPTAADWEEAAKDDFVKRYGNMIEDLYHHMREMPMDQFLLLGQALVACTGVVANERQKENANDTDA